jgi:uncharacterized protein (DUF1778 family)
MAKSLERKDHPVSMRLPDADIALIDRAAIARGRSRTDFVREAAVRAAEDVLMDQRLVRMKGLPNSSRCSKSLPRPFPRSSMCSDDRRLGTCPRTIGTDNWACRRRNC